MKFPHCELAIFHKYWYVRKKFSYMCPFFKPLGCNPEAACICYEPENRFLAPDPSAAITYFGPVKVAAQWTDFPEVPAETNTFSEPESPTNWWTECQHAEKDTYLEHVNRFDGKITQTHKTPKISSIKKQLSWIKTCV